MPDTMRLLVLLTLVATAAAEVHQSPRGVGHGLTAGRLFRRQTGQCDTPGWVQCPDNLDTCAPPDSLCCIGTNGYCPQGCVEGQWRTLTPTGPSARPARRAASESGAVGPSLVLAMQPLTNSHIARYRGGQRNWRPDRREHGRGHTYIGPSTRDTPAFQVRKHDLAGRGRNLHLHRHRDRGGLHRHLGQERGLCDPSTSDGGDAAGEPLVGPDKRVGRVCRVLVQL